jgi:hypothetical protein
MNIAALLGSRERAAITINLQAGCFNRAVDGVVAAPNLHTA